MAPFTTLDHYVTLRHESLRRASRRWGPPRGWRQPGGDAAGACLVAALLSLALRNRVAFGEHCGGAGLPRARAGARDGTVRVRDFFEPKVVSR